MEGAKPSAEGGGDNIRATDIYASYKNFNEKSDFDFD